MSHTVMIFTRSIILEHVGVAITSLLLTINWEYLTEMNMDTDGVPCAIIFLPSDWSAFGTFSGVKVQNNEYFWIIPLIPVPILSIDINYALLEETFIEISTVCLVLMLLAILSIFGWPAADHPVLLILVLTLVFMLHWVLNAEGLTK